MVIPSSPPKMLHVLKHETWGLRLHQVLFSVSHVHKWRITSFNSLFLNSLRLFPQMPINPKICLVILCPLAPADLSGRRPYSPSPSSVPCWPSIRRLNLSLWEFRWLKPWIHWTNTLQSQFGLQKQLITPLLLRVMNSASPTYLFSWDSFLLAIMKTNGVWD